MTMLLAACIFPSAIVGQDASRVGANWEIPEQRAEAVQIRANEWLADEGERLLLPDDSAVANEAALSGGLHLPAFNHYRSARLQCGLHLVSVESGDWTIVEDSELAALHAEAPPPDLARRLETSFVLLTERNVELYIGRLRQRYGFLTEGPTLHILVVTPECNLACIYCQASSAPTRRGAMTESMAQTAVERAFETPAESLIIEFQGGEPLLNFPAIRAAIQRASELRERTGKRVEFSLITNLTEPASADKQEAG